jgi:hypothetical protein
MRHAKLVGFLASLGFFLLQASACFAAPEVGWWWNPNESGRGFFIEDRDGVMYLAGYFYEADGRAKWLVSGGSIADPYSYDGRLLEFHNGQTLFGDYKPPTAPTDAGAISLRFSDDKHGTLTWPGGSIAIERDVFDPGTAAFQPVNGWWWNSTESGRGYSIEVQGQNVFIVSFMYDDNGNPVWYLSAGKMSSPTTYEGPWVQFAGGQTMAGPYRPPSGSTTVGRLAMQFNASDDLTLTFSDDVAQAQSEKLGAKAGTKKSIHATPQNRRPPPPPSATPFSFPRFYTGTFNSTTVLTTKSAAGPVVQKVEIIGNGTWVLPYEFPEGPSATARAYYPADTGYFFRYSLDATYPQGGTCTVRLSTYVNLSPDQDLLAPRDLVIGPDGHFAGKLVTLPIDVGPAEINCRVPNPPPEQTSTAKVPFAWPINIAPIEGSIFYNTIICDIPVKTLVEGDTTTTITNQCKYFGKS